MNSIRIIFLATMMSPLFAAGQQHDTLKTYVLEVMVFEGFKPEGDTLQNFYRSNPAATTEELLNRMHSLSLIRRGPYGREPVMHNLQGGQINVTVDGMKIFGACTDKMDPVSIYVEPQNLSLIQALAGTEGASFGSTFGGTVNLALADAHVGPPGITGQSGTTLQTSARSMNYFGKLNVGRQRSGYRVSATYRKNGDYRTAGGERVPFSHFEKFNLSVTGKWALPTADTLEADILYDRGRDIGFPALAMDVERATATIGAITYHRHSPWWIFRSARLKAYYNYIDHVMSDRNREVDTHMHMPGISKTSGFSAEADVHIFNHQRTVVKAEYFDNAVNGEMYMYPVEGSVMFMETAPAAHRRNGGLYVEQHLDFGKNKATLSWRGDLAHDMLLAGPGREQLRILYPALGSRSTRMAHTISLQSSRKLAYNVRLSIQGGYGERLPTLHERFGFYLYNRLDGYDYLGMPAVKNESAWTSQLALEYFGKNTELRLAPYYKHIRHYMAGQVRDDYSAMTPGAKGVKVFSSLRWANLVGADVMMLGRLLPALQTIVTMKYAHGTTAVGEPMPLIAPLKVLASARYDYRKLYTQVEWEGAAAQQRAGTLFGENTTSSWSVVNIRTGYKPNALLQCNGGVENIFDVKYHEHTDWSDVPRPGRNIYLSLLLNF